MKNIALFGTLVLMLAFCKSQTNGTPEEVAQAWQAHIDKNEFDAARELSTGEALRYVEDLATLNEKDSLAWENNTMLNLRCQTFGDSIYCTYHFEDELGEPIPGQLALKRVKGNWLVCRIFIDIIPSPDSTGTGEDLLFPTDTLNDVLQ